MNDRDLTRTRLPTVSTLTPEFTQAALSQISVGRRGKPAKVCEGYTIYLYWASPSDRKSKEDSGVHLLLRMPLGHSMEWWVKIGSLQTKGKSRWQVENLYRLTPEAAAAIAPKLCALIKRKAAEFAASIAVEQAASPLVDDDDDSVATEEETSV